MRFERECILRRRLKITMSNNRIAFLVLAHTDPTMLARFSRRLLPYGRVIVHIDRKSRLDRFERVLPPEVALTKERVKVSWAGYSMIRATLALMREGLARFPDAERFVLLSGLDYPARPLEDLVTLFEEKPRHNFIRAYDILASRWDRKKILNMRVMDQVLPFAPRGPLGAAVNFINRLQRRIDREITNWKWRKREYPFDMKPASGSQWWALTREAVEYILRFVDENPEFCRYYERTYAPDEHFIHTILLNSHLAAHADPIEPFNDQLTAHLANLHLIHDTLRKTYSLNDWDDIKNSGKYFVRKVTTELSESLLDRLDKQDSRIEDSPTA